MAEDTSDKFVGMSETCLAMCCIPIACLKLEELQALKFQARMMMEERADPI